MKKNFRGIQKPEFWVLDSSLYFGNSFSFRKSTFWYFALEEEEKLRSFLPAANFYSQVFHMMNVISKKNSWSKSNFRIAIALLKLAKEKKSEERIDF